MSPRKPGLPLQGEAAWKAHKQDVADRNAVAHARAREQRAARAVERAERERAERREEAKTLPKQPRRYGLMP